MAKTIEIEKPLIDTVALDKTINAHEALDQIQDLFCALSAALKPKLDEIKIQEKELKGVEDEMQAALDSLYPAADDGTRKTDSWLMEYSAKGAATVVIDKKALVEALGLGLFIELA